MREYQLEVCIWSRMNKSNGATLNFSTTKSSSFFLHLSRYHTAPQQHLLAPVALETDFKLRSHKRGREEELDLLRSLNKALCQQEGNGFPPVAYCSLGSERTWEKPYPVPVLLLQAGSTHTYSCTQFKNRGREIVLWGCWLEKPIHNSLTQNACKTAIPI